MAVFENTQFDGHEEVVFYSDKKTGLKTIIAIHNTNLGPALGGCRMYPYGSESDAVNDVLRLSRGMTYKAAMAKLRLGGGKSVIIGDPKKHSSEALFRAFGRCVQRFGGRYITAEDVGTSPKQMEWIQKETACVVGLPSHLGGSGNGDPSPSTAYGVLMGIKAAVKNFFRKDSLSGLKVAIQGVGNVGYHLCHELHKQGVRLFISDINRAAIDRVVTEMHATVVDSDHIYDADVDVYAPCALGATLNDRTIPQLKCSIVAGSANNQLENMERHGNALKDRNILYAPDYVINAGGLIHVYSEISKEALHVEQAKLEGIYHTLMDIFQEAEASDSSTAIVANTLAEKYIHQKPTTDCSASCKQTASCCCSHEHS